jgi:hypothetical protein
MADVTTKHPENEVGEAAATASGAGARESEVTQGVSRRSFLGTAVAAGAAAATLLPAAIAPKEARAEIDPDLERRLPTDGTGAGNLRGVRRANEAMEIRFRAARLARRVDIPAHPTNGDEERFPNRIGSFSKGLPHNAFGEVDEAAYRRFLRAVTTGDPDDFEAIPSGAPLAQRNLLVNPQSGLAFDLEGTDGHQVAIPPAPAFSSAEEAGEIVENYWMALLRDVPFSRYDTNRLAIAAAEDLSSLSDFRGPKVNGRVTPQTLFRENVPGALLGPYESQFFLLPVPFGAQSVERRVRTTLRGLDFLTDQASWLAVQNGFLPTVPEVFDPKLRFIRNGRDLSSFVHIDVLFQAYFNAFLTLAQPPLPSDPERSGLGAPVNSGNPYLSSRNQIGFVTFGGPYFASLVTEVATRSLKAQWYEKWFVHRRLRPEAFGGAIHQKLVNGRDYPIHPDALSSPALARVFAKNGTFFLPQAFPEGSPVHPAYGAGHATVAGACVTILKALFDESFVIPSPVEPTPNGRGLQPYTGGDILTVGGELNKIAVNVSIGRNIAGVHWRSDGIQSMLLGEEIAISVLRDSRFLYNERFDGFTFTKFDGSTCTI